MEQRRGLAQEEARPILGLGDWSCHLFGFILFECLHASLYKSEPACGPDLLPGHPGWCCGAESRSENPRRKGRTRAILLLECVWRDRDI